MKKVFLYSLCSFAFAFVLGSCNNGGIGAGNDAISLKFNFKKGSKYKYIMKNRQTFVQEVMGKSMTIKQDMDMESSYQVNAAEGNNTKLTVTYDRITMSSDAGIKKIAYDSDDTAHDDPMFRSLTDMLHKPFSMTVNDKGQIIALEGFKDLLPDISGNTPISDSSMRSMMQQAFNIYPDKPVKPGDSWNNSYNTSLGFMYLKTENTYKLLSVNNGIAHIEMNSKISSQPNDNPEMKNVKMELNGTQTGAIDVEIASGLMMGSTMTQQIKGTIDMMNMKAPISINSDINIVGATEK